MSRLEGKKAPRFKLPGSDGKDHALEDYRGRPVVLYFYPKDSTPGCTREACAFRDLYPKMKKKDVVVLGVSADSFVSHGKFIAEHKLPFPLLTDTDLTITKTYGAWGPKIRYGNKVEGVIRSTVLIDRKGKVVKHWPAVKDPDQHPVDVYEFLDGI